MPRAGDRRRRAPSLPPLKRMASLSRARAGPGPFATMCLRVNLFTRGVNSRDKTVACWNPHRVPSKRTSRRGFEFVELSPQKRPVHRAAFILPSGAPLLGLQPGVICRATGGGVGGCGPASGWRSRGRAAGDSQRLWRVGSGDIGRTKTKGKENLCVQKIAHGPSNSLILQAGPSGPSWGRRKSGAAGGSARSLAINGRQPRPRDTARRADAAVDPGLPRPPEATSPRAPPAPGGPDAGRTRSLSQGPRLCRPSRAITRERRPGDHFPMHHPSVQAIVSCKGEDPCCPVGSRGDVTLWGARDWPRPFRDTVGMCSAPWPSGLSRLLRAIGSVWRQGDVLMVIGWRGSSTASSTLELTRASTPAVAGPLAARQTRWPRRRRARPFATGLCSCSMARVDTGRPSRSSLVRQPSWTESPRSPRTSSDGRQAPAVTPWEPADRRS